MLYYNGVGHIIFFVAFHSLVTSNDCIVVSRVIYYVIYQASYQLATSKILKHICNECNNETRKLTFAHL